MTQRKVALVTGGGRGIGRAIALRLAAEGYAVGVASRSRGQLDQVVREIEAAGGTALALPCDVTLQQEVTRTIETARTQLGDITVLVNNAGVSGPLGPIGVVDAQAWWAAQAVHVLGSLLFMTDIVPRMAARGGGRIINVCSVAGVLIANNFSAYAVAKATLIRLSEHVAAERRDQNIQVFPIQPGTIHTDMARETLTMPDAAKWAAPLVNMLQQITPEQSDQALAKMQDFVADLARGRFDVLSGRYLDVDQDLAALLSGRDAQ
jgi:NAD(P)-dependent dehydrogenase (short-subunit alcohol dehydrogenase family)